MPHDIPDESDAVDLKGALEQMYTSFFDAYVQADARAMSALLTDDAIFVEPDRELIVGRYQIESDLAEWMERFSFSNCQWSIYEVEDFGGAVYNLSFCSMDATDRATGRVVVEQWKQVTLWKRERGALRLHRLVYNTHKP